MPEVIINKTLAPFLSKKAFKPTVVPCTRKLISLKLLILSFNPFKTAIDALLGLDNTLDVSVFLFSVSSITKSVNVPPISAATLYFIKLIFFCQQ